MLAVATMVEPSRWQCRAEDVNQEFADRKSRRSLMRGFFSYCRSIATYIGEVRDAAGEIRDAGREGRARLLRAMVTWGLVAYGTLCLAAVMLHVVLLAAVPLLDADNQMWAREENPVAAGNAALCLFVGISCMFLAKASNRTRFWTAAAVFTAAVVYGLYSL